MPTAEQPLLHSGTTLLVLLLLATRITGDLVDLLHDVDDDADYRSDYSEALSPSPPLRSPGSEGSLRVAEVQCMRDTTDGSIVCDCGGNNEPMTLPVFRGFGEHYRIRNCAHLSIPAATFAQATFMRSVHLSAIGHLQLEPGSLEFRPPRSQSQYEPALPPRGIQLEFRAVRIPVLPSHALRGILEQVLFDGCHLSEVHAFAISPTQEMLSLTVQNTMIAVAARHALKKFAVGQLLIANCTFVQAVPSGIVHEVDVRERLRIVGTRFGEVLPNAFNFATVRAFDLTGNSIQTLNGSSFHMVIADRITVTRNNITELSDTAFLAITSTFLTRPQFNLHFQPPEFQLNDNRIGNRAPLDLRPRFAAAAFTVRVQHFELLAPITCDDLDRQPASDFQRSHGDAIYMRTCADCEPISVQQLRDHRCRADRTLAWVAGGVSAMVVLLLLTVLTVWWLYRRRQAALARMVVVQPEARTYRETQIVIQIENAGLLKTDL